MLAVAWWAGVGNVAVEAAGGALEMAGVVEAVASVSVTTEAAPEPGSEEIAAPDKQTKQR